MQVYACEIEEYMEQLAQPFFERAGVAHKACAYQSPACLRDTAAVAWSSAGEHHKPYMLACMPERRWRSCWARPARASQSWRRAACASTSPFWTRTKQATWATTSRCSSASGPLETHVQPDDAARHAHACMHGCLLTPAALPQSKYVNVCACAASDCVLGRPPSSVGVSLQLMDLNLILPGGAIIADNTPHEGRAPCMFMCMPPGCMCILTS